MHTLSLDTFTPRLLRLYSALVYGLMRLEVMLGMSNEEMSLCRYCEDSRDPRSYVPGTHSDGISKSTNASMNGRALERLVEEMEKYSF